MTQRPVVQMKGISKYFPGVKALDDVSVDIYPGEVHVLIGENGAGKSTLSKILMGIYTASSGEIQNNTTAVTTAVSRLVGRDTNTGPSTVVALSM